MTISIDTNAGFCSGVVGAISQAEAEIAAHGHITCLGDIVHNAAEVERLTRMGMSVVTSLEKVHPISDVSPRVLIRAHGEPPSTYELARKKGITLVDATCPIVLALQRKVRKGFDEVSAVGGQVVIFGKPGHAEVVGLCGQTGGHAIVVNNPDDIDTIDFSHPIRLFSQTTQNPDEYSLLARNIRSHLAPSMTDFVVYDTICRRVASRTTTLREFAAKMDVVLFVGGKNSSNGHYLCEVCKTVRPTTFFISDIEDIDLAWFCGVSRIGITGATSTPGWLMQKVKDFIDSKLEVNGVSQNA